MYGTASRSTSRWPNIGSYGALPAAPAAAAAVAAAVDVDGPAPLTASPPLLLPLGPPPPLIDQVAQVVAVVVVG